MTRPIRIGLIGDFDPQVKAHVAIPQAVALAANTLSCEAGTDWLATPLLEHDSGQLLSTYDALWCVPASPYASMDGALSAIRFAREQGIPFLGTCGGCQHAIIEYARNVLGLVEADHAETNPPAAMPLIAPLACSLVEVQDTIHLKPGSRIAAIYGRAEIVEGYHCSYGLNPHYQSLLEQGGMRVTGVDVSGEARVIEIAQHPFFVATLFQPERSAFTDVAHPLIVAYLQAIAETMHAKSKS
jgi:CTP synthase (UTP-ammonia lyase)